jgi:hypothetical protein
MSSSSLTSLNIALIHHPVLNKNKEVIGSAVTNLDIHDIARTARTYGVARYFISTPYEDQHGLVQELIDHWVDGYGATYNPARKKALEIVRLVRSLDEILVALQAEYGKTPLLVTTSAIVQENTVAYRDLAHKIRNNEPVLILFGTAHGLAPEILQKADMALPPIYGGADYNHLSVRSAASIIMDRLLGS